MSAYSEKLKDPRWQRKRLEILARDGFECRDCGCSTRPLSVHHCHYERGAEPWEIDSALLLTLCAECHEDRGYLETLAKRSLALICSRIGSAGDNRAELVDLAKKLERIALDGETLVILTVDELNAQVA